MRDLNQDLKEARERRSEAFDKLHALNDRALEEKRDLTDAEKNEFAELQEVVKRADSEIDRINQVLQIGPHARNAPLRGNDGTIDDLVQRCSLFRLCSTKWTAAATSARSGNGKPSRSARIRPGRSMGICSRFVSA